MKVLVLNNQDPRMMAVAKCLNGLCQMGFASQIVADDIQEFDPDLVVSNFELELPYPTVKIPTEIEPFVDLDAYKQSLKDDIDCKSDVVFVGDLVEIGQDLFPVINNYGFKSFNQQPNLTASYCGSLLAHEVFSVYAQSKACIVPKKDNGFREMDICSVNGSVVYHDAFFLDNIEKSQNEHLAGKWTQDEIMNKHTNYDRMAELLEGIKINTLAKEVRKKK
jgi:hypothetical protein